MTLVTLDLQEFCRTGVIDSIPWGITREALQKRLGPPDEFAIASRKDKHPTIYLYGHVEFYVDPRLNRFYAVHWDNGKRPEGNAILQVAAWIVEPGVSQERVEGALAEAGIPFSLAALQIDGQVRIETASGVGLTFSAEEDEFSPPVGLNALSCWRWELLNKGDEA